MSAREDARERSGASRVAAGSAELRDRLMETLRSAGVALSATVLSAVQFLRHSLPSPDIVYIPPSVVLYAMVVCIVLPFLLWFMVDRLIAAADRTGARLRAFRVVTLAIAGVLLLREMQLYFGPVRAGFDILGHGEGPMFLLAGAGIAWAAWRWNEGLRSALLYMVPIAVVLIAVTFVQMLQEDVPPAHYEDATPPGDHSGAPIFVIVADELSYDVLADGDRIDQSLFPNFAALARESAWLTNATTNYVHTRFILPDFVDAVAHMEDDYQIRLYSQYSWIERQAWESCGVVYTCRGALHQSREHRLDLLGTLLRRSLFQVTPGVVEPLLARATGWMQGGLDAPAPNVDKLGMHTFTKAGFEDLMDDVEGESAQGTLYFYHLLLPHWPFVFSADGSTLDSADSADFRDRYRDQTRYLDSLLGELIAKLESEGMYDEATIIVTGDHGLRSQTIEDFEPTLDGAPLVTDELTKVPLLIRGPNVTPGIYSVDYQHKDFEATFLDALGRGIPADTPGVSAFAEERPEREKVFYVDQSNERYWTYVYNDESGEWDLVGFREEPLAPGDIGYAFEN